MATRASTGGQTPRLPSVSVRRHQGGFGTEHLKNDIREYGYPGKYMRPDTKRWKPLFWHTYQMAKAVPVASASGRVFRWWRVLVRPGTIAATATQTLSCFFTASVSFASSSGVQLLGGLSAFSLAGFNLPIQRLRHCIFVRPGEPA
jgi:hypothetical protein